MFEFVKRCINKKKKDKVIKNIKDSKNDDDIVEIIEKGKLFLISIKKDCTFQEYVTMIDKKKNKLDIQSVPMRLFIRDGHDILTCKLKKQLIWSEKNNNESWIVVRSARKLKISLSEKDEENIYETVLEIENDKYKIVRYIHDHYLSTNFVKWYPKTNPDISNYFSLEKKEALLYAQNLLDKISETKILTNDTLENIYNILELIPKNQYYPVISDNTTTLSQEDIFDEKDMNKKSSDSFHIIVNETKEKCKTKILNNNNNF